MYRITELANAVGLTRTTLLYYEKQQLLQGRRLDNGYRVYSDQDLQRLKLLQRLQAAGLTLKECKACLDAKIDRQLLRQRLAQLDEEIAAKQQSRTLLAALLGEGEQSSWHQQVNQQAPDAHLNWLMQQGFDEKEALRLKWLSKDMNDHERYMADFMAIFETLTRWGPGDSNDTLTALQLLPQPPKHILEIGCGNGLATAVLAKHSEAAITAVDNEEPALERLKQSLAAQQIIGRVQTQCASMTELPFAASSFDLIWSEGSAYIMGFIKALQQWRSLLKDDGIMVVSDMVWLTDKPSPAAKQHLGSDYPDMCNLQQRLQQINAAGYQLLAHFSLSEQAWRNYYQPLEQRLNEVPEPLANSKAAADIRKELAVYHQFIGEYGYQMFILKR